MNAEFEAWWKENGRLVEPLQTMGWHDFARAAWTAARQIDLPVAAYDAGRGIKIEVAKQHDGSTLWAVRDGFNCLANNGQWEYEPLPSGRDSEFFARCRYATPVAALAALKAARKEPPQ